MLSLWMPLAEAAPVFSVKAFGAKGDGQTLDTQPIQAAIDAAAEAGGGQVLLPPGTYLSGSLRLKSFVDVHISAGATLLGSTDLSQYGEGEGDKGSYVSRSLIYAERVKGISLTGRGTIDGQGAAFWDEDYKPLERPRPWLNFVRCTNLRIAEVKLVNSPAHCIALTRCQRVYVEDIAIDNVMRSPNTDGIDLYSCSEVFIRGCHIRTGDDAICLKSKQGEVMENILVSDCILESDDAAIKYGTGSRGINRYIRFENILIRNTRYGIALFMIDGGLHEHLQFVDIQIETGSRHKTEYPIYLDIDRRDRSSQLGRIEHITFRSIDIRTRGNILIAGQPDAPIRDLRMEDIHLQVVDGVNLKKVTRKPRGNKKIQDVGSVDLASERAHMTLGYIQGLQLQNVRLQGETKPDARDRHGVLLVGVADAEIRGLSARQNHLAGEKAAIAVRDSRNVQVSASKAQAGTHAFLNVLDAESQGIHLLHND
ncbi:MAG: glycosyl hydrolase family 28 protein, partial [Bacteroidota bacterium]